MKQYKITEQQRNTVLYKMDLTPYSLIGDSISYRAGYIRALQDLGLIDGLTAARMLIEVERMDGWKDKTKN